MKHCQLLVSNVIMLVLALPVVSRAAVFTWDGGGANNNWTTLANWNPDGAPVPAGDLELVFPTTSARYTIIADSYTPWTLNKLTLGSQSYSVSGNQLQFTGADARLITIGTGHGFSFSNPILLDSTLTYEMRMLFNFTFSGAVSGSGGLTIVNGTGSGGSTLGHLAAAGSYSGPTDVYSQFSVSGTGGSILNSSAINVWGGGVFSIGSSGPASRLGDSVPIYLNGGILGNSKADETVGVTTLAGNGLSVLNAGAVSILRLTQLERASNAVALVRGASLGQSGGSRILVNNPDSTGKTMTDYLVGGGGGTGTTSISIVPWLRGAGTAAADANVTTFVTYDATLGFRPLDTATEFVSTLAAAGATDNVRLTASGTLTADKTVNSLFITHQTGGINVSGAAYKLTVGSGAIAFKENNVSPQITVGTLDFNGREAIITETHEGGGVNPSALISSVITNAAGLTFSGISYGTYPGNLTLSGANVYTGRTTVAGGILLISGAANRLPTGTVLRVNSSGTFNLNGQNQAVRGLEGAGTAVNNTTAFRALTIQAAAASDSYTFSGMLTGVFLQVVKTGLGTQVLNGSNTYAGTTVVSNGTLVVNGTMAGGGGTVTVVSGATLGGTGTIGRAVSIQSGGILSPGNSPGTLTVASLTISNSALYKWEIGKTAYDTVVVTNNGDSLIFESGLKTLRLVDLGGAASTNNTFVLFQYSAGQNDNAAFIAAATNWSFEFVGGRWIYTNAIVFVDTVNNQILLTNVGLIPEPSTLLLLLAGGISIWRWRRRGGTNHVRN